MYVKKLLLVRSSTFSSCPNIFGHIYNNLNQSKKAGLAANFMAQRRWTIIRCDLDLHSYSNHICIWRDKAFIFPTFCHFQITSALSFKNSKIILDPSKLFRTCRKVVFGLVQKGFWTVQTYLDISKTIFSTFATFKIKVQLFWEGHKKWWNIFFKFCCLLAISEL